MHPKLKQRLVGATVISALAVIFLPMFFDQNVNSLDQNDFSIPEFPTDFETNAPPIPKQFSTTGKISERSPKIESTIEFSQDVKPPNKAGSTLTAWVVQAGSFEQQANANAIRDKLRKGGYPAFVETVEGQSTPLFRVRVGPELNRERAEQQLAKLEATFGIKGLVVSYP